MTSKLFAPITLGGVELSNRIVLSPMCQYSAPEGTVGDWQVMHLGQFAVSGAGLVMVEATGVEAIGRITAGCVGLYSDQNEAALGAQAAYPAQYLRCHLTLQGMPVPGNPPPPPKPE